MAFEADCGVSTVLEALRVVSTSRSLVPEDYRAMCGRDARTRVGG
jgi:hypothetical protein